MKSRSTGHTPAGAPREPAAAAGAAESPVHVPSEFPDERESTGTIDDDDEPEDEHDGENEASERETSDDTEAPEEFERDDEDRDIFIT